MPSTNQFTTIVTDYNPWAVNEQHLSATNSFMVFAQQRLVPPVFQSIIVSNSIVTLSWSSVSGRTYRLEYKDELAASDWNYMLPTIPALGNTTSATNFIEGALTKKTGGNWVLGIGIRGRIPRLSKSCRPKLILLDATFASLLEASPPFNAPRLQTRI